MHSRKLFACGFASLMVCVPALAGSHTWRFNEIFSNASGTVQFIELKCDISGENFVGGLQITTANGTFAFPANLSGSTQNKKLLIATAAFAALPGAPVPDYTIPANFIPINGGTIRYNPASNYDSWTYGAGVIPTNGVASVQFTSWNPGSTAETFTTATNSPTNYSGGSGSVNASCIDSDGDGFGNPGDPSCPNGPATDCNDSVAAINPNAPEISVTECSDSADNDCDGLTDCSDATCANVVGACIPAVSEWGVVALALLTLSAGTVMLRQRM